MSHQPLLRSSDALKNYTVTSLQVVAYLKAYKEEKPNKENIAGIKNHCHSASAIPELCIFPLSFLYRHLLCIMDILGIVPPYQTL